MNSKQQLIESLAYELWEARGRPAGSPQVDWDAAESRLSTQDGVARAAMDAKIDSSEIDSFPASDPPASHGADIPPSNAAAKWEVASTGRALGPRNGSLKTPRRRGS